MNNTFAASRRYNSVLSPNILFVKFVPATQTPPPIKTHISQQIPAVLHLWHSHIYLPLLSPAATCRLSFEPERLAASLRAITARHFMPMKKTLPAAIVPMTRGVRDRLLEKGLLSKIID
jgi:hypothetical protein